jgi:hypothetical protein
VYTCPGLFYIKLAPGSYSSPPKIIAAIVAVVGVLFGVASVVVIIADESKKWAS